MSEGMSRIQFEKMKEHDGFTLVEMSIVLTIIALLVAGVLIGKDLIDAATIRSQISQIDKYKSAVNVFRDKFGCLPGDCAQAAHFGFTARGAWAGEGDGNGVIEGVNFNGPGQNQGFFGTAGETVVFWRDLSDAKLIDGNFTTASSTATPGADITTPDGLAAYYPTAKLANHFIYVWSGSTIAGFVDPGGGQNFLGLSAVYKIYGGAAGVLGSHVYMPVNVAYNIDSKIDDGLPQSGNVVAFLIETTNNYVWASNNTWSGPFTTATPAGQCFDNGNVGGAEQHYSMSVNSGNNQTCGLSFRFQ